MVSIFDVAEFILERVGFASTLKLQKLAYYSQAYALVRCDEPLFDEDFEAWANGPVCPVLFASHRGKFVIGAGELVGVKPNPELLGQEAAATVNHVLDVLGDYNGRELSELTHREGPWKIARGNCMPGEPCSKVISKESPISYYASPDCANPVFA